MANCSITSGISISCDDLRRVGGLAKSVWVGNLDDLNGAIPTGTAYVTNLELDSYRLLYKFESTKFSHEATWQATKSDGGNVLINQTVILRVLNTTPTYDAVVEDLLTSDVFVIVLTNNSESLIYGAANGLGLTDGAGGSGRQLGDSVVSQLTLTGAEKELPKRFLRTDYATSLAYLDARTA